MESDSIASDNSLTGSERQSSNQLPESSQIPSLPLQTQSMGGKRSEPWSEATSWELDQLYKAVMLCPTLALCEKMLRGEKIHISKLDAKWVRRFGLRNKAPE